MQPAALKSELIVSDVKLPVIFVDMGIYFHCSTYRINGSLLSYPADAECLVKLISGRFSGCLHLSSFVGW